MGVRGGRGSYASIHLPNSTAALPLYPTTACCKYLLRRDRERVHRDNIRCLDMRKDTNINRHEGISPFLKCYNSSNDNHVEMLITEERGGSGWNVKRCMMEITDSSLGFFFNLLLLQFWWDLQFHSTVSPTVRVVVGWPLVGALQQVLCFYLQATWNMKH